MTHRYATTLDGMKHIETINPLATDDYVYIKDDLYTEETTLFKVKRARDTELDLKLVKAVDVFDVIEEPFTTANVTYSFNNTVVATEKRLSKNQIIRLNGRYYSVVDILKEAPNLDTISFAFLSYIQADNLYTVFKTHQKTKKKETVESHYDYGKALGHVYSLRKEKDEYYYHLG